MGRDFPPYYKEEDLIVEINKITDIDEQINVLLIQRELYVKDLKRKVEANINSKNKD